jgi:hypothetical protein
LLLLSQVNVDGYSSSPERLACLVQRLPPRESDIVEQLRLIGEITKGGASPASVASATRC